jgi:hypothetical protein
MADCRRRRDAKISQIESVVVRIERMLETKMSKKSQLGRSGADAPRWLSVAFVLD